MKKKEEKSKKREISNWWYWILIIVFLFSMFGLMSNSNYKECVDDCVSDVYDCIAYETAFTRYDIADYCSSDLEYCIRRCD